MLSIKFLWIVSLHKRFFINVVRFFSNVSIEEIGLSRRYFAKDGGTRTCIAPQFWFVQVRGTEKGNVLSFFLC